MYTKKEILKQKISFLNDVIIFKHQNKQKF